MVKKVLIGLLALMLVGTALLAGCGGSPDNLDENVGITITDMANRTVTIKGPVERAVAIGPGALRLYTYINGTDKLVGVEQIEVDSAVGRPYNLAHPELADLPVIGQGGPQNVPDPEKILAVSPDVIFSTYGEELADIDNLQAQTGIPVVELSYGEVAVFDPAVYDSLKLIGQIMNKEQRAQEVVDYMLGCHADLNRRTQDIPEQDKPRVYIGALGSRGSHGIESTRGNNTLLNAINAVNVADETGRTGSFMIDKEKLLAWDPDILIIDAGGLAMVQEDYKKNPGFYRALTAVKNGRIYRQLPYNYYTTNLDTAMADAYFLGKTIYPESFADIDPAAKADEIYSFLLGKPLYQRMCQDFGEFAQIRLY
ncbi:MAG: iron ABC transporter substrate-binding protein [Syntrophomonadaceae bacterium]|nr:iron ABC transporter substrate-binding protein [Syntrophomonadaceae bacterium]